MSGPDVIVIGAGVAGLTVARDLTAAGLRVLLLEARRRLGGRIMTHHTPDGPIELGAEFVHGAVEETLGVATRAGLPLRETDRSSAGEPREGSAPRTDFFSAIDTLLAHASGGDDESFQHLVDRVDVDRATKARGLGLVEGYHAADPAKISVQSLLDTTAADEAPGAERQFRFVRGYDGLVTALFEQAVRELCTVQLDAVVTGIAWRRGHAVVRTAAGAELAAPQVVVTVPLGVLKAGAIDFSPRLPGKEDALRRLEMGAAARVSLQFEHDGWAGPDSFSHGFLFTGEPPFPVWWISHPAPRPVITGWAGGRHALALAALGETERVGAALEALGAAVGVDASRLRGALRRGFCHDWQSDPFARGAYSYAGVGGRRAGTELAAPVDSMLFFAGEATQSDGRNATVHGAIASGQRAAKQVLAAAGGGRSP
jgi:monoamine oxidase